MQFTRESIFIGAIRTFCTAFAGLLGIVIAIALAVIGIGMLSSSDYQPSHASIEIAPDDQGNRSLLPLTSPAILLLNIHGVIGEGDLTAEVFQKLLLDSRDDLLHQDRVKGLFLHINTPGGTVTDADAIYRALLSYKKKYQIPVYAYVDGLCASGGMYIASACDHIQASTPSVIGSVGVIMGPTFNVSEIMTKWGIQSLTLTEGKDKDMLNPFRPWVPDEDQSLRAILASMYERFVDVVTTARPQINKSQLISEYGAQVFIAAKAQELGYIDNGDSSYEIALRDLVKAANIQENEPYQVMKLSPPHSLLAQLAEGNSALFKGKITHKFDFGTNMSSDLSGKLLYLYQP